MDLLCLSLLLVSAALVQGSVNTTTTNAIKDNHSPRNKTIMTDLTKIGWAHAVNSKKLLERMLLADGIDMIEADVVLGKLDGNGSTIPIMAHPPHNTSDITLHTFLRNVSEYNRKAALVRRTLPNAGLDFRAKGIKLDFKSIDAFNQSQSVISQALTFPLQFKFWLNADILRGPSVDNRSAVPVNPDQFLEGAKRYDTAVLSLGWTTQVHGNSKVVYAPANVDEMHQLLRKHHISQNVTFAVRAGLAAESEVQMKRLLTWPNSTLTIWLSNSMDPVNVSKLKKLIKDVGVNRTYLDVPSSLKKKLTNSASVATYSFGILLVACLAVLYQQFYS